jgi:hypothetical protein
LAEGLPQRKRDWALVDVYDTETFLAALPRARQGID